jgi:MinD-like ATPase involved in chromosome partitioning or flagellar assembly
MADPITFAFVSGKGGVGKTILASNFAWVCSQIAKTVLVDLDFQNQGCTGLFAPHTDFKKGNAIDAIRSQQKQIPVDSNKVAENLFFIPAISWKKRIDQEEITEFANSDKFPEKLEEFIFSLREIYDFEIIILDCHGGVDPVSHSAFQSSDYTLMVTEADSVTFSGTLELLNYYESKTAKIYTTEGPGFSTDDDNSRKLPSEVKFIVNRLPSKYKWEDLEDIYRSLISRKLGEFTTDESIFCYIPHEELLADSFGEYPFHVELAPKSIFAKKIYFMVYLLLKENYDLASVSKSFSKFQKERYLEKVQKTVISNQAKNRNYIVNAFAWGSTLFLLFLIIYVPILMFIPDLFFESTGFIYLSSTVSVAVSLPFLWYIMRANFGLMFYFRDKYKFQKHLFGAITSHLSLWQKLSLLKLFILRAGTSFIPFFMILYLLIFVTYFSALILGF